VHETDNIDIWRELTQELVDEGHFEAGIEKHREDIKAITRGSVRCPPRLWMTRTWERIGIPSPDRLRLKTWIRKAVIDHGKIILPRYKSAVSLRPQFATLTLPNHCMSAKVLRIPQSSLWRDGLP
jgi:hypothetical protein